MKFNKADKLNRSQNTKNPLHHRNNIIDEASKESFPTSDPPAWTLGTDGEISAYLKEDEHSLTHMIASDHLLLRNIIKLIDKMIIDIEQKNQSLDVEQIMIISDFLCVFLDKIHTQKEESMYPELLDGNKRLTTYMLNNLRDEHAYGRRLIVKLHTLCKEYQQKNEQHQREMLELLKEVKNLYHNHLSKEEEYILPYIKHGIPEAMQANFIKIFNQIEKKYTSKQALLNKICKANS